MASGSKTKTQATYLECPKCNNIQSIHRKLNRLKEKNHIKDMYCPVCKETVGHIEVKEDAFLPDWLKEDK